MTSVPAADELCALIKPYQCNENTELLFDKAMLEIVDFHVTNTPNYAQWLTLHDINPQNPQLDCWANLPPIFANYFKRQLILSNTGQDALELTSSGTSGQKSRMRFDLRSISAAQSMVTHIFSHYGWITEKTPCNYLLLSYEPSETNHLGTAYTDNFLCNYAPVKQAVYALRHTGLGYEFDLFGVIQALQTFANDNAPVRILGFPAFMWFVLERMKDMGLPPLHLAPESLAFFGGGWKTHGDKEIPKQMLYKRMGEQLGLPDERCRDGYGSVEHCVPYVECPRHHFHIPVYAKVWIRDTQNFSIKGYGERGFLQFVSPYITSSPAHSVIMSDLAILHRAKECGCGLTTDWFELLGRASQHAARNCALAASEFIQGK